MKRLLSAFLAALCLFAGTPALAVLTSAAPGHFTIPTAPSAGTAVAQSASANTYGSYVALTASTPSTIYVVGIRVQATTVQVPTYLSVAIGTGGAGSETLVSTVDVAIPFTAGAASTQIGAYQPIWPPISVGNATRVAVKTASSAASAISWNVALTVIAQSGVVPNTAALDSVNTVQLNGTNLTAADIGAGVNVTKLAGTTLAAAAAGYMPSDVRALAGAALGASASGYMPSDVRRVDGGGNSLVGYVNANSLYVGGIAQTAADLGLNTQTLALNLAQSGSTASTIKMNAGESATDNLYRGSIVEIIGGSGFGQARVITGYVGSTKVATVDDNWLVTPDNTTRYRVGGRGPAISSLTLGYPAAMGDVRAWLNTPISVNIAGVPKVDVTGVAGGAIGSAAVGYFPADVKKVNGVTVNGNGTSGNPWGP